MSAPNRPAKLTRRQVELLERPNCAVCGIAVSRESSELINGQLWCLTCYRGKPPRRSRRSALTPEERQIVGRQRRTLLKKDPHCTYCGLTLSRKTATIDHIVPKSKGGSTCEANLTLACKSCNERKADIVFESGAHVAAWLSLTSSNRSSEAAVAAGHAGCHRTTSGKSSCAIAADWIASLDVTGAS